MNYPGHFLRAGALSLLVFAVACGADGTEEASHIRNPASPSEDRQEPAIAVAQETALPAGAPSPAPTPEASAPDVSPVPTGPAQLVLLHSHELLRSEERQVDQLQRALERASVTLERVAAGERNAALEAWLAEPDPAVRAQMALGSARGNARAVLVLRFAPPVENRAQGVAGFGVIAGEPPHERLWARGDLPAAARAGLTAFLQEGGTP